MSWFAVAGPAAAQVLLLVVPGLGALRLAGVRGVLALVAAPAVTGALLGVAALVAPRAGLTWGHGVVVGASALAWGLALGLGLWRRRQGRPDIALAAHAGRTTVLALGALAAAAAVLALPIRAGMVEPHALSQTWDSVFHLSGVQVVREAGNASPLGGLAPLYGDGTTSVYYPTLWHSVVALSPGGSIPLAANVSTFVLGVGVWLTGLYGLARAALPSAPAAAVLTPLVAASFFGFPTATLSTSGQWPNGMAVALLPGAAALVLVVARRHIDLAAWSLAAAAVLGVVMAHGSGLFALVVVVGAPVLVLVGRTGRQAWRAGRGRAVVVLLGAGVLGLAAATVVLARGGLLSGVLGYPRAANGTTTQGVVEGLLDIPMVSDLPGNVVAALAAVLGVVVVLVRREGRWLVLAWAALVLLVGLATGPENDLRWLSGFWYKSAPRIAALVPVAAAPLGAIGLWGAGRAVAAAAARLGAARRRAPAHAAPRPGQDGGRTVGRDVAAAATALAVLAGGWAASGSFRADDRAARFAAAYVPGQIRYGTLASAEEVELLRSAAGVLPEGATVVGDPYNGAAYLWSVAGIPVVFPQLGSSGLSEDQWLVRQRFRDLHEDPAVCAALDRLGATHFYADEPGVIEATDVAESFPGMYGVDTSRGFVEVARAGTARVHEITACG